MQNSLMLASLMVPAVGCQFPNPNHMARGCRLIAANNSSCMSKCTSR